MKIKCKLLINVASKVLLIASLFIFSATVLAQTDVYVGDEDVIVEVDGNEVQVEEGSTSIDTEDPASSNVQEVPIVKEEVPPAATNTSQTKTIQTAPAEAPESGPKEALIISVSILIGLAFAIYFLFKSIKEYNS